MTRVTHDQQNQDQRDDFTNDAPHADRPRRLEPDVNPLGAGGNRRQRQGKHREDRAVGLGQEQQRNGNRRQGQHRGDRETHRQNRGSEPGNLIPVLCDLDGPDGLDSEIRDLGQVQRHTRREGDDSVARRADVTSHVKQSTERNDSRDGLPGADREEIPEHRAAGAGHIARFLSDREGLARRGGQIHRTPALVSRIADDDVAVAERPGKPPGFGAGVAEAIAEAGLDVVAQSVDNEHSPAPWQERAAGPREIADTASRFSGSTARSDSRPARPRQSPRRRRPHAPDTCTAPSKSCFGTR